MEWRIEEKGGIGMTIRMEQIFDFINQNIIIFASLLIILISVLFVLLIVKYNKYRKKNKRRKKHERSKYDYYS